jgi:hypothetical protein
MNEEDNERQVLVPDVVDGIISSVNDDSAQKDFEIVRANLMRLATQGVDAVELAAQVAEQSQHPNAYLALARMLETATQTNKEILELQRTIRSIAASSASTSKNQNVTNQLFVGSTADLMKMLDNLKKKEIE